MAESLGVGEDFLSLTSPTDSIAFVALLKAALYTLPPILLFDLLVELLPSSIISLRETWSLDICVGMVEFDDADKSLDAYDAVIDESIEDCGIAAGGENIVADVPEVAGVADITDAFAGDNDDDADITGTAIGALPIVRLLESTTVYPLLRGLEAPLCISVLSSSSKRGFSSLYMSASSAITGCVETPVVVRNNDGGATLSVFCSVFGELGGRRAIILFLGTPFSQPTAMAESSPSEDFSHFIGPLGIVL